MTRLNPLIVLSLGLLILGFFPAMSQAQVFTHTWTGFNGNGWTQTNLLSGRGNWLSSGGSLSGYPAASNASTASLGFGNTYLQSGNDLLAQNTTGISVSSEFSSAMAANSVTFFQSETLSTQPVGGYSFASVFNMRPSVPSGETQSSSTIQVNSNVQYSQAFQGGINGGSGVVKVNNLSQASTLSISSITAATGLSVTGPGKVVLGDSPSQSFTGSVSVSGSGNLDVTGSVTGPVSVSNGNLTVNGTVTGPITIGTNGITSMNGTVTGGISVAGSAYLAPGLDGSIGSISANNSISFDSGSTLKLDLNTTTADSILMGTSSLNMNSGAITQLSFLDSYTETFWSTDKSWNIFSWTGTANVASLSNTFDLVGPWDTDITNGPNVSNFKWASTTVGSTSYLQLKFEVTAVPEPSSLVLLGVAGAVGIGVVRRRTKKDLSISPDSDSKNPLQ